MIDCVITITILVEDNTLYFIHFNHTEGKRLEGAPVVNRLFEKKSTMTRTPTPIPTLTTKIEGLS